MTSEPKPLQVARVGRLRVRVYATRAELGAAAGRAVARKMRQLLKEKGAVRMMFAAAPSQNEFLATLREERELDWGRVTAFHMDEYVGLGPDAPQSFVRFLREHLYDAVRPGTVHNLNGLAADPQAECERYAALLRQAPLDIVCAGIGENGHLAFNDPPFADFDDELRVKVVQLAERSREQQVHDGCFTTLDLVPRQALTVTIPALMAARHISVMVPGPTKAQAVHDTLLGPITEDCPASVLRRHPSAVLYVDLASSALWRVAAARRGPSTGPGVD